MAASSRAPAQPQHHLLVMACHTSSRIRALAALDACRMYVEAARQARVTLDVCVYNNCDQDSEHMLWLNDQMQENTPPEWEGVVGKISTERLRDIGVADFYMTRSAIDDMAMVNHTGRAYDYIIAVNDSVIVTHPPTRLFAALRGGRHACVGGLLSPELEPHLQSWLRAFRVPDGSDVFCQQFDRYMAHDEVVKSKASAIEHLEVGMHALFESTRALFEPRSSIRCRGNPHHSGPVYKALIDEQRYPFVKFESLRMAPPQRPKGWNEFLVRAVLESPHVCIELKREVRDAHWTPRCGPWTTIYVLYHDDPSGAKAREVCAQVRGARPLLLPESLYMDAQVCGPLLMDRIHEWEASDFAGTVSYSIGSKTAVERVDGVLEESHRAGVDVVGFFGMSNNMFAHMRRFHPLMSYTWLPMTEHLGYTRAVATHVACPVLFSSSWVTTPRLLCEYTAVATDARAYLDTLTLKHPVWADSGYAGKIPRDVCQHKFGVPYYPHHVFLIERLAGLFFWERGCSIRIANRRKQATIPARPTPPDHTTKPVRGTLLPSKPQPQPQPPRPKAHAKGTTRAVSDGDNDGDKATPCKVFDHDFYTDTYEDLARLRGKPRLARLHYVRHGRKEGRHCCARAEARAKAQARESVPPL